MRRFLLKPAIVFVEGSIRWTVHRRLADGRILLESDEGEPLRIVETELWARHASAAWQLDRDSIAEAAAPAIEVSRRDASTYKEKDRQQAQMRLAYLRAVATEGCAGQLYTEVVLAHVAADRGAKAPPSYRSFCRWKGRYRIAEDVVDIIPRHERKGRTSILAGVLLELVEEEIETHYLNQQRPTVASLYDRVVEAIEKKNQLLSEPLPVISRATLYRHVHTLDWYMVTVAREGRLAARRKYRPVYGTLRTQYVNERWEIDHTPVNLLCICPKRRVVIVRPILTVVIDAHSRMVMGFQISARVPGQEEVGAAIRMGMLGKGALLRQLGLEHIDWPARGVPSLIVADNGMEFHGTGLRYGCADLGIELAYCPSRSPWHKGRVERFMRTVAGQLFHNIPGTTWSSTTERGDYESADLACITLEDLTKLVVRWIVEVYQHAPQRGLRKRTPNMVWQESCREHHIYMAEDPKALEIAFAGTTHCVVTNRGVTFDHLSYNNPGLQALRLRLPEGEKLRVRYFCDRVDTVQIFDPARKEYIEVVCTDLQYATGLTRDMHAELVDQLRRESKVVDMDSLRRSRVALSNHINELYRSHRMSDRRKAARLEGHSSKSVLLGASAIPAVASPGISVQDTPDDTHSDVIEDIPAFAVSKRSTSHSGSKR
ncbi:DDE-type integrase/transposase/recombinase [Burkholderia gladioli]|uniref:DDE-type integrase/transposase/recombinase n=1 Tax=Burkholderia gladioli TaxID=28095 RepID=UPI001C2782BC|nr:DDE-type integrase/transposase/recombinase [Burkholderia gladioli]MBU9321087.1 DDE-type integrase/transposase/recombinase [Burkholderia gladioli]